MQQVQNQYRMTVGEGPTSSNGRNVHGPVTHLTTATTTTGPSHQHLDTTWVSKIGKKQLDLTEKNGSLIA